MRLFVAIDLSAEVVAALDRLVGRLRATARINWSRPGNLHLTTKFVGEWPQDRLTEMTAALGELTTRPPIPIEVGGLGFFPNAQAPRVFWAGVHAAPGLAELARDTERALERLGVPSERRSFSPHLTLARIKTPVPLDALRQAIAGTQPAEFGAFTADRFFLYQSTLQPSGSVYTRLAEFPFTST
jgi:2'-5' RNA ligase